MLRDRGAIVLIAEKAGAPIGYVTGTTSHDPRRVLPGKGVVGDWYVDEAARGHGAGRALLEALERSFADAGCEVIESATWSFNPGARAAHLALGFREVQITYRKAIARGRRQ
jgi:phosphinothricin acetyltransferase